MKRNRLLLSWYLLTGLLLLATFGECLKGTALVISKLKQKPLEADNRSADEEAAGSSTGSSSDTQPPSAPAAGVEVNATTKSPLTGIPQKDYIHDPNLPRELNGYNLTEYPFYDRVPEEIDFKCDGLHDGFYASILHKCQVYHHCLFGTRYDFLCANYTAFDQKTFICHFVSEVDCVNSAKYFKRNEALYKQATTTVATTTTAATQPPPPARRLQPVSRPGQGRRRPYRPRRPEYDYYYDDDYEEDPEYYDEELPAHRSTATVPPSAHAGNGRRRKHRRPQRPLEDDQRRPESAPSAPFDQDDPQQQADKPRPSASVYDRHRVPPKIRPPVPLNERNKYDYTTRRSPTGTASAPEEPAATYTRPKPQARPAVHQDDEYYDDEEEAYVLPERNSQSTSRIKNPDTYPPTATNERDIIRRPTVTGDGRPLRRNRPAGPSRRRPAENVPQYAPLPLEDIADDYDQPYDQEPRRPVRPANGRRKRPQQGSGRQEDYYRPTAQSTRQEHDYSHQQKGRQSSRYGDEEDDEPVPASRPAYISTAPGSSSTRQVHRKRVHQQPQATVDEYTPSRSQASESMVYRSDGQRKHAAPVRKPVTYSEEPSEETDYYDDEELPEQNYQNRQTQTQRGTQVAAGPFKQSVNPLPSPPPTKVSTNAEEDDDDVILPPQRSGNSKRPFLPSRGGNPSLPRGLQPLGSKAPQQTSNVDSSNDDRTGDKQGRFPQPLTASNYQPKVEDDYEEEDAPRLRTVTSMGRSPDISDALTSRPISQSNYKSGEIRDSLRGPVEEELPRRVQSGNNEYRSKVVEDNHPRTPSSATGNFRTKQATSANVGETATNRNANFNTGKYKPNSPETVQENPPLPATGPSSSSFRTKDVGLSTAKTPSGDNPSNQQISQPVKTPVVASEDIRSVTPFGVPKVAPSVAVYRTPTKTTPKLSINSSPRVPDLPAQTNLADIDESEYDVTLNDALHPTLHPTRSVATALVSFPQQPTLQRVQVFKTKIGLSSPSPSLSSSSSPNQGVEALSNDPSSSSTGGRGYLAGSASQRHITRAPYASLSDHVKDPRLVVVDTDTRGGQLAYAQQQGGIAQYNTQQARKKTPITQYDDKIPSHDTNPPRYTQTESQYRMGVPSHESGPLLLVDDTLYSNERQRSSWIQQQQRREPNVGYATLY